MMDARRLRGWTTRKEYIAGTILNPNNMNDVNNDGNIAHTQMDMEDVTVENLQQVNPQIMYIDVDMRVRNALESLNDKTVFSRRLILMSIYMMVALIV
jgi:hypothetical protein